MCGAAELSGIRLQIHLLTCRPILPALLSFGMRQTRPLLYLFLVAIAALILTVAHDGLGFMDDLDFERTAKLFVVIAILGLAWSSVVSLIQRGRK